MHWPEPRPVFSGLVHVFPDQGRWWGGLITLRTHCDFEAFPTRPRDSAGKSPNRPVRRASVCEPGCWPTVPGSMPPHYSHRRHCGDAATTERPSAPPPPTAKKRTKAGFKGPFAITHRNPPAFRLKQTRGIQIQIVSLMRTTQMETHRHVRLQGTRSTLNLRPRAPFPEGPLNQEGKVLRR